MYIKVGLGFYGYRHQIFAANHVAMFVSSKFWRRESESVRAAKKMAKKLNIEYREN